MYTNKADSDKDEDIFIETMRGLHRRALGTIDQLNKGFNLAMLMYNVVFYSGIVIIFVSIAAAFDGKNLNASLLGGSIGIIDILTFFVFKPINDLQKSRARLIQLTSTFLTWFNDIHNWNSVITKHIDTSNHEDVEKYSNKIITDTFAVVAMMSLFMKDDISSVNMTKTVEAMTANFQEKIKNIKL